MAGEISTAGITISYATETTAGTRPTTGYKMKETGKTLNINEYVTGISGLSAEYEQYDVTPLSATERHQFVRGLMGNDGNVSLSANINPTSRSDWNAIADAHAALTGGKSMWWCIQFPGDTEAFYFRGEPCPMQFPDIEAASAVQGSMQIIESGFVGWAAIPTPPGP